MREGCSSVSCVGPTNFTLDSLSTSSLQLQSKYDTSRHIKKESINNVPTGVPPGGGRTRLSWSGHEPSRRVGATVVLSGVQSALPAPSPGRPVPVELAPVCPASSFFVALCVFLPLPSSPLCVCVRVCSCARVCFSFGGPQHLQGADSRSPLVRVRPTSTFPWGAPPLCVCTYACLHVFLFWALSKC